MASVTAKNEAGNRYGRLMVVSRVYPPRSADDNSAYWLCRCDCGTEVYVSGPQLRRGKVRSCGCLRREQAPRNAHGNKKERL